MTTSTKTSADDKTTSLIFVFETEELTCCLGRVDAYSIWKEKTKKKKLNNNNRKWKYCRANEEKLENKEKIIYNISCLSLTTPHGGDRRKQQQ